MKVAEVDACQYQNWSCNFKNKIFKSTFFELDESFIQYLKEDGVFYPEGENANNFVEKIAVNNINIGKTFSFPKLESNIRDVIYKYGHVYPKLNWSSPRDASWIVKDKMLKCDSVSDIFLLLKSSDFIIHDLEHAYDNCEEKNKPSRPEKFYLVLKKWYSLNNAMEFRCFIRNSKLVGISQRDFTFYEYMKNSIAAITERIIDFYYQEVFQKFQNSLDVYVGLNRIYIIDFNPWGPPTDPLLFTWEALNNESFPFCMAGDKNVSLYVQKGSVTLAVKIMNEYTGLGPSALYLSSRRPWEVPYPLTTENIERVVKLCQEQNEDTEAS